MRRIYPQQPGSWSPDGTTLIFEKNRPETGWDLWTLSTIDDDRALFYRNGDDILVVDVAVSETIALSDPEVLFEKRSLFGEYDVMPDGRGFIMVDDTETDPAPTQLNLVLNWSDELARLVVAR